MEGLTGGPGRSGGIGPAPGDGTHGAEEEQDDRAPGQDRAGVPGDHAGPYAVAGLRDRLGPATHREVAQTASATRTTGTRRANEPVASYAAAPT